MKTGDITLIKLFEDTKVVNRGGTEIQLPKEKEKKMVQKILLKIEQHEPTKNSGALEGFSVPAPLVVLILLERGNQQP